MRGLRILRRRGAATTVHWLPTSVEEQVPENPKLNQLISNNQGLYAYRKPAGVLVVKRRLSEDEWRALLKCFNNDGELLQRLKGLRTKAASLLSDEELRPLESYARRTRGEIFFSTGGPVLPFTRES